MNAEILKADGGVYATTRLQIRCSTTEPSAWQPTNISVLTIMVSQKFKNPSNKRFAPEQYARFEEAQAPTGA